MRGRIEDGALVTLASVAGRALHVNDIVLVRWKSNYLLHLIKDIADGRYLIGNNRGHINGWVDLSDIVAVVVEEAPETIECSPKPIS